MTLLGEFRKAAVPPAIAWVRFAMRMTVATLIWLAGFHSVAQILAVLSVVMVVGSIEVQVAKVLMKLRSNS